MRCSNCGWDNPANLQKCVKCNSKLNNPGPVGGSVKNDVPLEGTVRGVQPAAGDYLDRKPNSPAQAAVCPSCGYPLLPGAAKCPECGSTIQFNESDTGNSGKAVKERPKTVNPWQMAKTCRFTLQPMIREGEKEMPASEFTGEEVALNRDNLEKNNPTLTGATQAVIKNVNGEWYIEDKSSLQTTFIHVSGPLKLQKGDIILMGDRKFRFDC